MMDTLLLLALNGLIWGLIIALIALGLSVIFGLLDIINIAHGDFFMVGTVLAWASLEATGNFWIGFILVPLICLDSRRVDPASSSFSLFAASPPCRSSPPSACR